MSQNIPYIHTVNVHNTDAAHEVLPTVLDKFTVGSIVDFGSGLCTWLKVAKELGVREVQGIDGDWVDVKKIVIPLEQFMTENLTDEISLGPKFDLAICLEVAEHLPPDCANTLVDNIVRHSDLVLWSAAIEGQGGQNHLNERNPSYWDDLFRRRGFYCEDSLR